MSHRISYPYVQEVICQRHAELLPVQQLRFATKQAEQPGVPWPVANVYQIRGTEQRLRDGLIRPQALPIT